MRDYRLRTIAACIIILLAFMASACSSSQTTLYSTTANSPGVHMIDNGMLDAYQSIAIHDGWEFYWNRFIMPGEFNNEADTIVNLPSSWTKYNIDGKSVPGQGYATFRTVIKTPDDEALAMRIWKIGTASRVYVNGKLMLESGKPGMHREDSIPGYNRTLLIVHPQDKQIELVIHASNFHHSRGGIRERIEIGRTRKIRNLVYSNATIEILAIGVLLMIVLYHFLLFLANRSRTELFWFALFSLAIFIRLFTDCSEVLFIITSQVKWEWYVLADYLTLIFTPYLFFLFLTALYPHRFGRTEKITLTVDAAILATIVFLSEPYIFSAQNNIIMLNFALIGCYLLFKIIRAILAKEAFSRYIGAGLLILFSFGIHDIMVSLGLLRSVYMLHTGTMLFFSLQAVMLAGRVADHIKKNRAVQLEYQQTNSSYERFVPSQFIDKLKKTDIVELRLGDHVIDEITVMFVGLVEGQEAYRNMEDGQKIDFLDDYIEIINNAVQQQGGFIDKCVGTDVMVLFTSNPEGAYAASIEIINATRPLLESELSESSLPIRVGIGIHSGEAALGIIGERKRTESTVVSDAVNMASRIKGANAYFHTSILISSPTFIHLGDQAAGNYRLLGKLRLKGKTEAINIFEVFSTEDENTRTKLVSREAFEQALLAYFRKEFSIAKEILQSIADQNPADRLVQYYLEKIWHFERYPHLVQDEVYETLSIK